MVWPPRSKSEVVLWVLIAIALLADLLIFIFGYLLGKVN